MSDAATPIDAQDQDSFDIARRTWLALLPGLAFVDAATAQDAVKMVPSGYKVVLENSRTRVLEFNSRPGMGVCGTGMHSHPAHLSVALTAAKARIKLPDGKTFEGENKPGDVFWSEAETHEVENIGGKDVRALIIEFKPATGKG